MKIEFFVPGIPAPAGSKRAFVLKRGGVYTGRAIVTDDCKRSKPWQQEIKSVAMDHCPKDGMGKEILVCGPLEVTFEFCVHRPAGHYGSGKNENVVKPSSPRYPIVKPDVLKLARAAEDALTNVIWNDDAQIVREFITKEYVANNAQSGVRITIEELEPDITPAEATARYIQAHDEVLKEKI